MYKSNHSNIDTQTWPQTIVEIVSEAHSVGWSSEEIDKLWHAHDLMARLFAGRYRGSGRPFINHLAGTASLALRHEKPVSEVLAAYAHAAYAQGEFGRLRRGASKANRRELREVVGDVAEALIADYAGFDWRGIAMRQTISEVIELSNHEKRLLFLHIVNELDDSFDFGVYNAEWCQGCLSRLGAGADFARALAYKGLADQLQARISFLRSGELTPSKGIRPKKSETILNPCSRPKYILKCGRTMVTLYGIFCRVASKYFCL